ncbi:Fibronectin type III domain-containing protein 5 [Folsomia candida]|uniref:Fibronectin type III domain-containing protein 5 n=1 Tax=Folsomia candida TaxID=158441 RepID=A0A226CZH6_FOLCA|nr:Fibronectin type III domain-containing protein 5 [Folsomia candida]
MTNPGLPLGHCRQIAVLILISCITYVSPDVLRRDVGHPTFTPGGGGGGVQMDPPPYNVSIHHLSPHSVEVSWNCKGQNSHDKYEVTLKPLEASYRVIETVPFNTCFIKLERLDPNTSYQVSVASFAGKVRKRSSSVIFRTFADVDVDYGDVVEDDTSPSTATSPSSSQGGKDRLRLPRVRLVEVSLVGMALILWAGAIVLFFHRWGKRPFATCRAMRFIERFLLRKNKNAPPLHTRLQGDEEDHLHLRQLLHDAPSPGPKLRLVFYGLKNHHLAVPPTTTTTRLANNHISATDFITTSRCCRVHQLAYAGAEFVGPLVGGPVTMSLPTKADLVTVPVTDTGCSPIRPRLNSFIVYDINDCRKEHRAGMYRKSKSAEHLAHYAPFTEEEPHGDIISVDVAGTEI